MTFNAKDPLASASSLEVVSMRFGCPSAAAFVIAAPAFAAVLASNAPTRFYRPRISAGTLAQMKEQMIVNLGTNPAVSGSMSLQTTVPWPLGDEDNKDQPKPDGQILSSKPWASLPEYGSLDDFSRNYFPKAVYDEARKQTDFDVLEITYSSDGIPVRRMLIKPKIPGDRKWPAIIFNRGGTGDYSRITDDGVSPCSRTNPTCLTVVDLYQFSKAGFVVIASDYRFHGPTARRDEWGGVDVDDVLNLVPALKSFDFVDQERLYMLGVSRGGTMTYIALTRGILVKAAAVIAAPADLKAWADQRPDLVNGDDTYDGFARVWPDYEHRSAEYYRARSAVCWAEQIKVPVLILHSRTDSFVPVTQALQMAEALQEKNKVYALQIYEHDGHSLPLNREDRNRRIVDWFNKFGATGAAR